MSNSTFRLPRALLLMSCYCLSLFCAPSVSNAQSNAQPAENTANTGPVLSEQDVVDMALEYSGKLKSYNTNVEIAEYRHESSGKIRNPELRIRDISTRYIAKEYDEMQMGLRLRLPDLGELDEKKQQAQVRVWERKVQEIRYQQELVARIRRNYATVLMYDQQAELAYKRVLKEDERLSIIKRMVDLGNRSVVYFTKAKMWHAEAKNDYSRAIQKQSLERRELAKRSGIAENTRLVTEDIPEVMQDLDELVSLAMENRPEIKLVQERVELAARQNNYERLKRLPWFSFIEMSYHKEKNRHRDWGEVMLGINLPLFDRNNGNIKATDLAAKMKEGEFDAIRESIEEDVRLAFTVYQDLLLDWKNFQAYAVELITNAQEVIDQSKKHETLLPDEVMEMELTIIETQKLLSEKRRDLAHALFDLYYAIGIEQYDQLN